MMAQTSDVDTPSSRAGRRNVAALPVPGATASIAQHRGFERGVPAMKKAFRTMIVPALRAARQAATIWSSILLSLVAILVLLVRVVRGVVVVRAGGHPAQLDAEPVEGVLGVRLDHVGDAAREALPLLEPHL